MSITINGTITAEGVEISYKNFSGRETRFNEPGMRYFTIKNLLDNNGGKAQIKVNVRVQETLYRKLKDGSYQEIQDRIPQPIHRCTFNKLSSKNYCNMFLNDKWCDLLDEIDLINPTLTINARTINGHARYTLDDIEATLSEEDYAKILPYAKRKY